MYNEQILIVEDEPAIREMIVMTLEMAGFDSLQAADVSEAHQQVVDHRPALILLDWMLPGDKSGIDFCRLLKNDELLAEIPVIMLTAKSEEDSKVHGLDAGADDYMTKPFSTRELISRIKAVLRRSNALSSDKPIEIGNLSLDPKSQRVTAAGKVVDVGPTEYRLLAFFMSHPERAYTRTQLLDQVWGGNVYIEDRTIDVHIKRLRTLLRPHQCDTLIQTVRGTGYRFSSFIEPI
ncbi:MULTISPECIES: phosphate regulon transcriptional regulator PhoB [Psychrobacter]|jgi:two-component system phosphate regulon response regulator PhoB|uniref:Phosphate regulon transcriptional regulatory protein PhoB n=1 Tax=Psychrobacter immobilis TaxID=498 RepID=A0A2V1ZNK5_PSYIM|nr:MULTISPECIES: phosphate regulon transcriptional regulator PhoB [Psychrobacter]KRG32400.1 chemotaxis protein CheY [Psychrobacter sp. P11F6]MCG3872967.1 phosphate regulon transcriptional regulator PhoB [Psychrobacter sp. Ps7]MDN5560402.1 phosphate regulon transcriptional regulator PhoB [Psychrobacter sp.]PWK06550.1 winged helix family two component transcriptional regulator [Psychrobacter immobilis]